MRKIILLSLLLVGCGGEVSVQNTSKAIDDCQDAINTYSLRLEGRSTEFEFICTVQ